MVVSDYRIDPKTGAVLFRPNSKKQEMRQMRQEIDELKQKVTELENTVLQLKKLIEESR